MADEIPTVFPDVLKCMLEKGDWVTVVDVREDDEVAAGKIPQAIHIRLADIPSQFQKMDRSKDYVMVCRSGHRSAAATEFLQSEGFHVRNMEGGMLAWTGAIERH
ncbi:rhodanese-like domain-containing protein [Sporolactobacillus pectinivorans]|uniref:rhodanese-like domain-containing protein n=1 Tax=Sporolactobacillus pectinivorans TaxID=1591408 RepID=UPI000C25DFEB|nr:rhodanese-like domain-containing protein [Sporolactobacillus pectinivorans]